MHEQRVVDDGAPELGGDGARAVASPAWEWLEQQIDWYDRKSDYNQRWFKGLKLLQIVIAAAIPVAAAASAPAWLMGAGGAVIVILEGVQQLEQYQQNWTAYRSTCESLKHERFLFLSRAGPYLAAPDADALLAERVDGLCSQENLAWVANRKQADRQLGGVR